MKPPKDPRCGIKVGDFVQIGDGYFGACANAGLCGYVTQIDDSDDAMMYSQATIWVVRTERAGCHRLSPAVPARHNARSPAEIQAKLAEVEADDRLWYETASLYSNSILAVEQTALRARANTLRWMLGLPGKKYFGEPRT